MLLSFGNHVQSKADNNENNSVIRRNVVDQVADIHSNGA